MMTTEAIYLASHLIAWESRLSLVWDHSCMHAPVLCTHASVCKTMHARMQSQRTGHAARTACLACCLLCCICFNWLAEHRIRHTCVSFHGRCMTSCDFTTCSGLLDCWHAEIGTLSSYRVTHNRWTCQPRSRYLRIDMLLPTITTQSPALGR